MVLVQILCSSPEAKTLHPCATMPGKLPDCHFVAPHLSFRFLNFVSESSSTYSLSLFMAFSLSPFLRRPFSPGGDTVWSGEQRSEEDAESEGENGSRLI